MSTMFRSCLVLAVLASGCMKRSATYCAKNGADDPENCPPVDAPGTSACASNMDCANLPATLVCNTDTDTCVECNAASMQIAACVDDEPVCDTDDQCRACESHGECLSDVCLPDGRCGTDANVAYVTQGAAGTTCTKDAPCPRVADALATTREYIKISGTIDENVVISNRDVTLLAAPDARIARSSGTLLQVTGTSNVDVYDLQFGSETTVAQIGVELVASLVGVVSLQRVRVVNTSLNAVLATGGTLVLERSRITDNPGGGLTVRSSVTGFTVRNNFILFNGKATGNFATRYGGANIEKTSATSAFQFNTVAYNESDGQARAAGVDCIGAMNVIGGNLIYGNREGSNAADMVAQLDGSCDPSDSFIAPSGVLGFASMLDPHLTAASPTTVRDAIPSCETRVTTDIDGDPRPSGSCDVGADEYIP